MAREIGEQLATRLANPTFTAVYRILNERSGPTGGLGTAERALVEKMRSDTNRAPFEWARESVKELTAAKKKGLDPGRADAIATTVQGIANALEAWDEGPPRGAAERSGRHPQRRRRDSWRQLRTLDRLVTDAKIPEAHAGKLGALGDAAAAYLRSDARNAQNLLGGEA